MDHFLALRNLHYFWYGLLSHSILTHRVLRQRGYRLWVEGELDEDGMYPNDLAWMAEKNGYTFHADNPIELLGLTGI